MPYSSPEDTSGRRATGAAGSAGDPLEPTGRTDTDDAPTASIDPSVPEHVMLLSIDALRADHLGVYGYHRETSPTIDHIARSGVRFRRAYSPSGHTREAVPAMLSGRYPSAATTEGYRPSQSTIGHLLQGTPARSAGIHSNPYLSDGYGYADGFDHFDDDMLLGKYAFGALAQRAIDKLRNRHYARAETITGRGLEFLRRQAVDGGRRTFTWLHYMDVHGPYEPPGEFRTAYTDRRLDNEEAAALYQRAIEAPESIDSQERQQLIDLYDGEIRYIDQKIADLLDTLETLGVREETLLLLTADHGEAFGTEGYFEHLRQLPESLTHVPLIAAGAGVEPSDPVTAPVSTIDIAPTVGSVFGVEMDGPGRSLSATAAEPDPSRVVFAQARGEQDESHLCRYAGYRTDGVAKAVVDRDRQSRTLTQGGRPALEAALHDHIDSYGYGADGETGTGQRTAEPEPETAHRLEALGYIE